MAPLRKICIVFMLSIWSFRLLGSPQRPDYIIFEGDTFATYNLLLEPYLQKLDITEVPQLFGLAFRQSASLNCWRGYQAIYLLENDSLFLVEIIDCGALADRTVDTARSLERMSALFGSAMRNNRVFMDWVSGTFSYPIDNSVLRWDGVFYTIYERETVVKVDSGSVVDIRKVTNYEDTKSGIDRRNQHEISGILFEQLKEARWKNSKEFDCSSKYIVTINEKGIVSKVRMNYTDEEIESYYDKRECNFCLRKMQNALKQLRFDIIKDKGVPVSEDIYIEIWMEDDGSLEDWTY